MYTFNTRKSLYVSLDVYSDIIVLSLQDNFYDGYILPRHLIRHCLRKANHFTWLTYITEYKLCNQHVSNADTQRELIVTYNVLNAPYNLSHMDRNAKLMELNSTCARAGKCCKIYWQCLNTFKVIMRKRFTQSRVRGRFVCKTQRNGVIISVAIKS